MATDWAGTAAVYDASFGRLCAGAIPELVARLPATSAQHVLDAGTGTGRTAAALAASGHRVVAVDADPGMVVFAAALADRLSGPVVDIEFGVADLMELPFDDGGFDASVANFVVNHLPVPRIGMRELVRVTRPGGVVAATVWPSTPVSAFNALWNEVIERSGAVRPAGLRLPPEHDFDRTRRGFAELLRDAGLADVASREISWTFRSSPGDLWACVEAGIASIGTTYRAQDARMRAAMLRVFDELTAGRDELELPSTALLAEGTAMAARPSS